MIRFLLGLIGTLAVLGGVIFLGLGGLALFAFWNDSGLQMALYANEAQVYGIMAVVCFVFALVINIGTISYQLEKVQDLLADLGDVVEGQDKP